VLVRLPDWWKKRPRPRVSVRIGDDRQPRFDANGMLDFQISVALGDEQLTAAELQSLMQAEDGLVLLRGQWVEVDRDRLQEALEHWKQVEASAADGVSFVEGMRLLAGAPRDLTDDDSIDEQREWSFVQAGDWLGKLLADLRHPEQLEAARACTALKTTLRRYQQTGVSWLSFLTTVGLGACLADDMGLGKTIQVLALLLAQKRSTGKRGEYENEYEHEHEYENELLLGEKESRGKQGDERKPSLLVLPASLLGNWKSEIEKFAPSLNTVCVHPSETSSDDLKRLAEQPARELRDIDVVMTTYGMLQRHAWLLEAPWRLVVLDEAPAIRNPAARQTKAVKRLKADARIALTGTPIENRLSDLWSLFDLLCPGLLGSQQKFKEFVTGRNDRCVAHQETQVYRRQEASREKDRSQTVRQTQGSHTQEVPAGRSRQ